MGHADIQTTMRYLHYAPREEDARLVAEAFRVDTPVVRNNEPAELPVV
jgi:integrase